MIKRMAPNRILPALLCTLLLSCSGGGGDGGTSLQTPSTDLSGTWSVQETVNGNCQGSTYPEIKTYTAIATQSGNDFTFTDTSDNTTKSGTISGSAISIKESTPSGSGTLTGDFSGAVSSDGNTFSGSGTWTWASSSYSCNGTSDVSATRSSSASAAINVAGTWNGTWNSTSPPLSGGFTAVVSQSGSTLGGTISVTGIVSISNATLTGTVTGSTMTFGDINNEITFTGTVNSSADSASGSYTYPALNNTGSWSGSKTP